MRWARPRDGLLGRGATTQDGRRLRFPLNWTHEDAEAAVDFDAHVVGAGGDRGTPAAREEAVAVPARSGVLYVEVPD